MTEPHERGPARITRRSTLRSVGAGLTTAIAVLGGCAGPIARMGEQTTESTTEGDDGWGFTVAVGPDGRPVFELATETPLRVQPGTTISFEWKSDGHDIHVASQPDEANWQGHESTEDAGLVHEHTFIVVGRYQFFCERHREDGMVGTIVVGECDCGPPTATGESA